MSMPKPLRSKTFWKKPSSSSVCTCSRQWHAALSGAWRACYRVEEVWFRSKMQNAQHVEFAIKRLAPKLSPLTAGKEGPHLVLTPVVHEGMKGCAELFRWSVLLRVHNQHWLIFCHSSHDAVAVV